MKLGTHNSMSYLPAKKWYLTPFKFMARCQSKSIEEQYELGARMFDLRVAFDKSNSPEFRHGMMRYKGNVLLALETLNHLSKANGKKLYVRFILETKKESAAQELLFIKLCKTCESLYPDLRFFGGNRKFDWKKMYGFKNREPKITQLISSMTGTVLDDWYPRLYAKFFNKKNYKEWNSKEWLLLDFIEYALE